MMKIKISAFFLLLTFSPLCFAKTLATVGGKKITLKDFNKKLKTVREQSVNPPYPAKFLDELIRYEAGVLQAKKEKVNQSRSFQDRMKRELYKVFVDKKLGASLDRIRINTGAMKRYYKSNPEVKTSHILIKAGSFNPREVNRAKSKAVKVLRQIQSGKLSFKAAARKYSEDEKTKKSGGKLPSLGEASLVPSYYKAAKSLKVGEVHHKPVRSNFGFHIIKLNGKASYKNADKTQIRIALINKKRKRIFDRYFNSLLKKYKVSINKDLLKTVR